MFREGWTSRYVHEPLALQRPFQWCLWKARAKGLTDPLKLARRYSGLRRENIRHPSVICSPISGLEKSHVIATAARRLYPEDTVLASTTEDT